MKTKNLALITPKQIMLPQNTHQYWSALGAVLGQYRPIELTEIEPASLLERYDRKFLLTESKALSIAEQLTDSYRILTIDGIVLQTYSTLYFDTPGFDFYLLQVNQRANQYKVRVRTYEDTHTSFLEIKRKNHQKQTYKERVKLEADMPVLDESCSQWLKQHIPGFESELQPVMFNSYRRTILVNLKNRERVSLDFGLSFASPDKLIFTPGLVIAEIKRLNPHQASRAAEIFKSNSLRSCGFSKYGAGIALTYKQLKNNRMKSKLRQIEKITKDA